MSSLSHPNNRDTSAKKQFYYALFNKYQCRNHCLMPNSEQSRFSSVYSDRRPLLRCSSSEIHECYYLCLFSPHPTTSGTDPLNTVLAVHGFLTQIAFTQMPQSPISKMSQTGAFTVSVKGFAILLRLLCFSSSVVSSPVTNLSIGYIKFVVYRFYLNYGCYCKDAWTNPHTAQKTWSSHSLSFLSWLTALTEIQRWEFAEQYDVIVKLSFGYKTSLPHEFILLDVTVKLWL